MRPAAPGSSRRTRFTTISPGTRRSMVDSTTTRGRLDRGRAAAGLCARLVPSTAGSHRPPKKVRAGQFRVPFKQISPLTSSRLGGRKGFSWHGPHTAPTRLHHDGSHATSRKHRRHRADWFVDVAPPRDEGIVPKSESAGVMAETRRKVCVRAGAGLLRDEAGHARPT